MIFLTCFLCTSFYMFPWHFFLHVRATVKRHVYLLIRQQYRKTNRSDIQFFSTQLQLPSKNSNCMYKTTKPQSIYLLSVQVFAIGPLFFAVFCETSLKASRSSTMELDNCIHTTNRTTKAVNLLLSAPL